MHPRTSGIGVVAVCPFLQPTPSMVLPAEGELEVRIEEESGEVYLNEDGQNIFQLLPGDRVCIRRARRVLCLVTGNGGETYFQVLREKGFTSW